MSSSNNLYVDMVFTGQRRVFGPRLQSYMTGLDRSTQWHTGLGRALRRANCAYPLQGLSLLGKWAGVCSEAPQEACQQQPF